MEKRTKRCKKSKCLPAGWTWTEWRLVEDSALSTAQRPSETSLCVYMAHYRGDDFKNIFYKVLFHLKENSVAVESLVTQPDRETHTVTVCLVRHAALEDQFILLSNEDFVPTDRPAGLWEIILSTHMRLRVTPPGHTHPFLT